MRKSIGQDAIFFLRSRRLCVKFVENLLLYLYNVPVQLMPIETTYSSARSNLASLLSRVIDDREVVVINRRGLEAVAMVSASELSSLLETAHLLRSPKNAQRLLRALTRAQAKTQKPSSMDRLREEFGVGKRKEK